MGELLLPLQAIRGWQGLGTGRGLAWCGGVTVCQARRPCAAPLPGGLVVVVVGTREPTGWGAARGGQEMLKDGGENRRVWEAEIIK